MKKISRPNHPMLELPTDRIITVVNSVHGVFIRFRAKKIIQLHLMYLNTLKNIAISSLCRGVSWDLGALGCFFVPQVIGIFNQRENQCPTTHWV